MTDALKARDAKDVEDAVRWALAEGKPLELAGRGSKRKAQQENWRRLDRHCARIGIPAP